MIIRERPSAWRLFFILRGSVVHKVAPQILGTGVLAVLVDYFHDPITSHGLTLTPAPFTLIGLALSIFLGFKNSAAYDRYWEGRRLWGELLVASRTITRQLQSFLPFEESERQKRMGQKTIAFAYALRNHLRAPHHTEADDAEILKYLEADELQKMKSLPLLPNAILSSLGQELKECRMRKLTEPQMVQAMDETLNVFARVLGSCERIRFTPIPFSYTLMLHRTAYLYCFLLPFGLVGTVGAIALPVVVGLVSYTFFALEALGEELEEPFGVLTNDLPLSSLCRSIEISVLSGLGETVLPPPLEPKNFQLT